VAPRPRPAALAGLAGAHRRYGRRGGTSALSRRPDAARVPGERPY